MLLSRLKYLVAACVLALGVAQANADTFNVFGTFSNGATLTGSIGVDNGTLLGVDLNGDNALPGDPSTVFAGAVICAQLSCGPSLPSYAYIVGQRSVSETYVASTQTYNFFFNGDGFASSLTFDFTLQGNAILGGKILNPLCANEPGCPPPVDLVGGTLVDTAPLPAPLSLFATGLAGLGLLGWRRKRKDIAA